MSADESADRAYWDNHTSDGRCKYPLTCAEDGCHPVTVQPARDQPMTNHDRMNYWWRRATQAEAELDSWMARAYEAEKRAWQAEARIKAVRELLDNPIHLVGWDDPLVPAAHVRHALEG